MLTLDGLGIEFGGRWLMRDVSAMFVPGERVGLIGRNGAGKSSLLRIIAGQNLPSEGRVTRPSATSVAYFHQDLLSYETELSIFDVAKEGKARLLALKDELDALHTRLEAGDSDHELWDRTVRLQDEFDTLGGQQLESDVHAILDGLGFPADQHHRPFKTFSGGWRMRVLLARLLLQDPSILLLDEPTNHLDLPSIQWLESYLRGYNGVCILVSHDRFFMQRMANRIVELTLGRMDSYSGNYDYYLVEKEQRKLLHQRAFENQQKMIETQEQFINRFRAKATKARQVQSRIKQLDKVDRLEAPEEEAVSMHFDFKVGEPSGKEVVRVKGARKSYGDLEVIRNSEAEILRGDKIGLIGANGMGKSTMLRMIDGREPFEGVIEYGYRVRPTFYAQHQLEALNLNNTVFQELREAGGAKTDLELRTVLGCFMFSGEDADKPIRVLSGGEKSRVALAKTLISEANFLLLDEPTNHLDMTSIQVLIESLRSYQGSFIVVSHDRFFLQEIANKIWYFEDRELREYPGGYLEYAEWQAARASGKPLPSQAAPVAVKKEPEKVDYNAAKQLKNKIRKLEQEQQSLETQAEAMEKQMKALADEMAQPEVAADFNRFSHAQKAFQMAEASYNELMAKWEVVSAQLEEVNAQV